MTVELRDVAPGLWPRRRRHPDRTPGADHPRAMLEHVLVAQGEPVHGRAFEAAFDRPPRTEREG